MSDPHWSEFRNPRERYKVNLKELHDMSLKKTDLVVKALPSGVRPLARKDKPTVEKSILTYLLLDLASCTVILGLLLLDLSKWTTSMGEQKAWEELQQCDGQLQKHQENFFQNIGWGDCYRGEIENELEGLNLVQSISIEPMRDVVVVTILVYIVMLAYSLPQVRNDWLIHFLVLCAFVCLHTGSYLSEKAANYFYRVKEMEKKLTERWPHDVVLYLHLASPTCILLST